jgi:hypothetical protein
MVGKFLDRESARSLLISRAWRRYHADPINLLIIGNV